MTSPRFKLTYWPIAFRGCFVSYLLAWAEADFETCDDIDVIIERKSLAAGQQPIPWIGPPLLEDRETGEALSQVPAIVLYLSHLFGLQPEDPFKGARCLKVQMDCNDLLMEMCCYNGTFMWERSAWTTFRQERLPRWMNQFESELERGAIGAQTVTFADIATTALFGNMIRCLPELEPDLIKHAPRVHDLCARIASKKSLAAHIAGEARRYGSTYCGGQIEQSIRTHLDLDAH